MTDKKRTTGSPKADRVTSTDTTTSDDPNAHIPDVNEQTAEAIREREAAAEQDD